MFTDSIHAPVVALVEPVYAPKVRNHCRLSYPGHPRGCPNWGRRPDCPPKSPPLRRVLDLARPVWLVGVAFDLGEHARRMQVKHPAWSERQCRNLLYWQGPVRVALEAASWQTALRHVCSKEEAPLEVSEVLLCPEGYGTDMVATAAQAGITLEFPPRETVWKLALVGRLPDERKPKCP